MTTIKLNPNVLYQNGLVSDTIPTQTQVSAIAQQAATAVQTVAGVNGPTVNISPLVTALAGTTAGTLAAGNDARIAGTITFEQFLTGQTPDSAFPIALAAAQAIRAAAIAGGAENPVVRLVFKNQFYKFQNPIAMTIDQPGILLEPEHTHCEIIYENYFTSTENDKRGCGICLYIAAADVTVRGFSFRMPNNAPAGDPNTPAFPLNVYSNFGAPLAAIFICAAPRCTIDNCIFPDGNQFSLVHAGGSLSDNQTLNPDVSVTNCFFVGVGGGLIRCVSNFLWQSNRSENIVTNTTNPPHQVYFSDHEAIFSINVSIMGCLDYNNQSAGDSWKVRKVNGLSIIGCVSWKVGRGIMADTCTNVIITGNIINGLFEYVDPTYGPDTEAAGIEIWDSPGHKVHGNLIVLAQGADVRAIRNRNYSGVVVTGQCSVAQTDTSGTTIICPSNFSTTAGFYVGYTFYIVRGTGVGQQAVCTAYSGATQVATFASASFSTILDTTSYVHVFDNNNMQGDISGNTIVVDKATGNTNPVIDVLNTDYVDLFDNTLIFAPGSAPLGGPFIYSQDSYGVRVFAPRVIARKPGEAASFNVSPFNFASLCGGVTISLESLRWPLSSSPATVSAPSDSVVRYDYGRDIYGNVLVGSGASVATLSSNTLTFSGSSTNYVQSPGSLQITPGQQMVLGSGSSTYLNSGGSIYFQPTSATTPSVTVTSSAVTLGSATNTIALTATGTNYLQSAGSQHITATGQMLVSAGTTMYLESAQSIYFEPGGVSSPTVTASATGLALASGVVLQGGGGNTVVDGSGNLNLRSYTLGTLPTPGNDGIEVWCSNLGGGAGRLESVGGNWRRVNAGGFDVVSSDPGSAWSVTYLSQAPAIQVTATLAESNSTLSILPGSTPLAMPAGVPWWVIYQPASGTGTLTVRYNANATPVKVMQPNTWLAMQSTGSNLIEVGSGSL